MKTALLLSSTAIAVILQIASPSNAADQFFAGDGSAITAAKWGASAAGPFTSTFTAGNTANFATVNGTGTGGSITVSGIVATENFTLTGPTGTISNQGNGVVTIDVAPGKMLDLNTQSMSGSATAGYIKSNDGILAMAGNTYQNGFTLNAGTIIVRGVNAMGTSTGGTNALTINGGIIASNANRDLTGKYPAGITIGADFQIGDIPAAVNANLISATANLTFTNNMGMGAATRTITLGNSGVMTFGGNISGSPGTGLIVNANANGGSGILVLSGTNTYDGGTTINGGGVRFGKPVSMFTSGAVTAASGTTLAVSAGVAGEWTTGAPAGGTITGIIAGIGGQGTADQVTWSSGATFGIDTASVTASGTFSYSDGIGGFHTASGSTNDVSFAKLGIGILSLSGTNTYTGNTYFRGGTLAVGASGAIPDVSVITGTAGAFFSLNGFDETVKSVSGAGGTVQSGTNTLTLDNPTGETFDGVISATFTDATTHGRVVKQGSGKLTLTGSSTGFVGEFIMNAGILGIGSNNTFGNNANSSLTINGGEFYNPGTGGRTLAMGSVNIAGSFTVDGLETILTNPGDFAFEGPSSGTAVITLTTTPTINVIAPVTENAGKLIFNGIVGESGGSRGIIKTGSGTLSINNSANTYSGDTEVQDGEVRVDADGKLGTGTIKLTGTGGAKLSASQNRTAAIANPLSVLSDSTIQHYSTTASFTGINMEFSSNSISGTDNKILTLKNANIAADNNPFRPTLSGSGFDFQPDIVIQNGTGGTDRTTTLQSTNTTGTTQTFSGNISGDGKYKRTAVTPGTGGATVFTGTNLYSGGTTVEDGQLLVNNTSGSGTGTGPVSISSGGTLGGTGTVGGAITNNGTIAPGTSVGTLTTTNDVTFGASSHFAVELSGASADKLVVGGNLDLLASEFLDVTGTGSGSSWLIATYTGTLSGTFDTITSGYAVDTITNPGQILLKLAGGGIPGDWNGDGHVNAADYVTWRKDPTGHGGPGGYDTWRQNFNNPPGSGAGLEGGAVPEPATFVLVLIGLVGFVARRAR